MKRRVGWKSIKHMLNRYEHQMDLHSHSALNSLLTIKWKDHGIIYVRWLAVSAC